MGKTKASNTKTANTAVLSIDVQQSFPVRPYWREDDVPAFRGNITRLIEGATERGWPVVRILHEEDEGAFSRASGLVKPLDWMPKTHAVEFVKHVHNAFTDTGLERWLRGRGITRLVIAGIRTEQCCETTTRVASDLGYEVDFVGDATLTFPMTDAKSGREFSAAEIRERTELVLRDRFARIATVDEALAGR
jgi:nicotinamidase-related amidase